MLSDTIEQNDCSEKNPEHQTEEDCTEETEAIDAPQELEEEHTEEHESQLSNSLEEAVNTTEPKSKEYKLPKTKRSYTFKQTIENLHSGKPAYSRVDTSPGESTHSQMRTETLNSGICEPTGWEIQEGWSRQP